MSVIGLGPIYRHHIFTFGAIYAKTAAPKPKLGWFGEWDRKAHYLHHLDGIMSLQKSGKTGGKLSAREEYDKLLAEEQEELTNEWYEAHLRGLLNRRRKKKK